MPARKRSRENAVAAAATDSAKSKKSGKARPKKKKGPVGSAGVHFVPDPSDAPDTETRYVQPYEATKPYICPGCNRDIPGGMGHLVAVPQSAPDLRRHWHRGCWSNRQTRR